MKKILIIGSGIAGVLLEKDIRRNHREAKVIGFIDDRKISKNGQELLGDISDLSRINELYQIDEMIIAIPSASGDLMRRIILNNLDNKIPIKLVPRSQRIIREDNVKYSEVKDVELEDFLGRPFLKKNVEKLKSFYKNKIVLVTGGAGSIGSEIVRQLIDLDVTRVVIYDNSEYLVFSLDQNLRERGVKTGKYKLILGTILDAPKIDQVIKKEKPDIIFHAAAYKHVYLMEDNIDEAVKNNVIGTKNVVDAAVQNKVKNFIFISTDKVVNPTSIMGATKKIAEYYIRNLKNIKTKFNIVRFGNVINSHGSVLPLFERQINEHGYVTVTHKEIKRYFMSIREAAQLVISSAAWNGKGEIFILDMGELIKIYEIALCLIRSKNLIPDKEIEVRIIGLKKGEKMIEELFTKKERENLAKTKDENIFRLKNFEKCPVGIEQAVINLELLCKKQAGQAILRTYFKKIFPSLGENRK